MSMLRLPKPWPIVLTLVLSCGSFSLQACPTDDLQLVGQGKMSWLFFDLYLARFYSADGHYQPDQFPQALCLRYQRNIDKKDLLKATVSEWQRLGVRWKKSWQEQLAAAWPSVRRDDELTLRIDKDGASHFYFNDSQLGEITDTEFGPAFLAIWLSPDSKNPGLTRQLKGN
ncbi:MAG TPA: chalcone isomerase family protein [Marinobacter sp.]|nr:chalcone isomerase family protein [Marinobacter sp.]